MIDILIERFVDQYADDPEKAVRFIKAMEAAKNPLPPDKLIDRFVKRYANDPEKAVRFITALKRPSPELLPVTKPDAFKCCHCGQGFKFASQLSQHIKAQHPPKEPKERNPVRVKKREPVARAIELMLAIKAAINDKSDPDYIIFEEGVPVLFLGSFCANIGYDHLLVLWMLKALRHYSGDSFVREIRFTPYERTERAYKLDAKGKPIRQKDADHKIGRRVLVAGAKPIKATLTQISVSFNPDLAKMTDDGLKAAVKAYSTELRDTSPRIWLPNYRKAHGLPKNWRMEKPADFQAVWGEAQPMFSRVTFNVKERLARKAYDEVTTNPVLSQ